jgi:diadenosine tetraphosphate (Ap4A) HIT family hydrolase
MFQNIQVPTAGDSKPKANELGKILSQSRLNTAYSNQQLQNHVHVHIPGIQQQKDKFQTKILKRKS